MSTEPASATAEAQALIDATGRRRGRGSSTAPSASNRTTRRRSCRAPPPKSCSATWRPAAATSTEPWSSTRSCARGGSNRAAVAVSEERYDDALAAFCDAEELDLEGAGERPQRLNRPASRGDLEPASQRFARYLAGAGDTAEGYYLVASNYALAGYAALVIENLRGAIERYELTRRRAFIDACPRRCRPTPRSSACSTNDVNDAA